MAPNTTGSHVHKHKDPFKNNILSPLKANDPFVNIKADDDIREMGLKRLNSIDDTHRDFAFPSSHIAAQKHSVQYRAYEVPSLSKRVINRKMQGENLASYAERHGINGIAFCGPEDEFNVTDELNFDELMQNKAQWYE